MTRGVDEGDPALVAVDLGGDLVGADVLGDPTGLLVDHVGVAERVEQLGLSVVDVTHHGHDRRPDDQVGLVALVLTELEVEGLEQLAVLVLGRDDLDDVVELLAEQLERRVVDRLGRGDHLAEAEQHLHELGRVDADPVGEVGQRGAAREPDGLAVALADAHAADRRGLHGLELLATGPLGLAAASRRAAGATEGTLGRATLAGTTAAGTATATGAEAAGTAAGSTGTGTRGTTAAGAPARPGAPPGPPRPGAPPRPAGPPGHATAAGATAEGGRGLRHHRRVGARHAGPAGRRARRTVAVDAPRCAAAGAGRRPMPWLDANGLLPGRGAPGRLAGRGAGWARVPWAAVVGGRAPPVRGGSSAGASTARPGSRRPGLRRLGRRGGLLGRRLLGARLRGGRLGGCLGGAGCGADALAASSASPYSFLNFISTGSSIVEEGDLTNSPISFSFSRTSLLSMP